MVGKRDDANITRSLFAILRDGQPKTRTELAAATGSARSTIASRIDALLESGIVLPVGDAPSTGGRPPAQIAFNPALGLVAGVDVGASRITVALTDLAGKVVSEGTSPLDVTCGPQPVLDRAIDEIRTQLKKGGWLQSDLAAVGIGLPGPVEGLTGRLSNPTIKPGWGGFDVSGYVSEALHAFVLVDNDVNLMALGEQSHAWPDVRDMIFLKVATGIGAGIISGGSLQTGTNGTAGQAGHVTVSGAQGVLCQCGNSGCVESVASVPAIAASLRRQGVGATTASDVVALVQRGNITAARAVRQAGRDLGEMLSLCVSLLNPSVIVVGGSMARAGDHLIAGICETVYSLSAPLASQHLQVVPSKTEAAAGVLGASKLAADHVLDACRIDQLLLEREASAFRVQRGTPAGGWRDS